MSSDENADASHPDEIYISADWRALALDMAMLLRRIVARNPNDELNKRAWEYLKQKRLVGSITR